jgi:hypothetical protein
MRKNIKETSIKELYDLLDNISNYMEEPIEMYALGGTALTILGIKLSTLDIDINIDSKKQYEYTKKIFQQIGFKMEGPIRWLTQEGLAFDLFYGSNILGTELLEDCLEISKYIKSFGNIKLYTLSLYDIIISKLARGDVRDFEDIKHIFEKEKINQQYLVKRYKKTMEASTVAQYPQKLLDLIEIKFKEWNLKIDKEIIAGVKKWDEH